jgi:hypothetical protein
LIDKLIDNKTKGSWNIGRERRQERRKEEIEEILGRTNLSLSIVTIRTHRSRDRHTDSKMILKSSSISQNKVQTHRNKQRHTEGNLTSPIFIVKIR